MKVTFAAVAAMMVIPGIAMAQQDTSRTQQDTSKQSVTTDTSRGAIADTGMRSDTGQQGVTMDTSRGAVAGGAERNMGLTNDQVKQLQTALDGAGCKVTADGNFGSQTDEAIYCYQKKENISGKNLNEVLRKLNLGFTATDSIMPKSGKKGGMQHDTSSMQHDTSTMRHDTSTTVPRR